MAQTHDDSTAGDKEPRIKDAEQAADAVSAFYWRLISASVDKEQALALTIQWMSRSEPPL